MGNLYVFDHDRHQLHPPNSEYSDGSSEGWFNGIYLRLETYANGASVRCLVEGLDTGDRRERVITKFESSSRTGVFREYVEAMEEELVEDRGWEFDTIDDGDTPGRVFQRLRDAAAGTDPTPRTVPRNHRAIQSLLEDGETVTIRVENYSLSGELVLRYGSLGRDLWIVERRELVDPDGGLVVVHDETADGMELAAESRDAVHEQKLQMSTEAIATGVKGLTDVDYPDAEAAKVLYQQVSRHFEDVDVVGPQQRERMNDLVQRTRALEKENEELKRKLELAREMGIDPDQGSDDESETGVTTETTNPDGPDAVTDETDESTPTTDDEGSVIGMKTGIVVLTVLCIILLGIL